MGLKLSLKRVEDCIRARASGPCPLPPADFAVRWASCIRICCQNWSCCSIWACCACAAAACTAKLSPAGCSSCCVSGLSPAGCSAPAAPVTAAVALTAGGPSCTFASTSASPPACKESKQVFHCSKAVRNLRIQDTRSASVTLICGVLASLAGLASVGCMPRGAPESAAAGAEACAKETPPALLPRPCPGDKPRLAGNKAPPTGEPKLGGMPSS
mmetsp:Transcript_89704/g.158760  ORF Transcript_89704/g.158760 Transcript_89704/m.158760 type:complete len:214 (+) Transcript_89704:592-1233(+)